MAGDDRRFAIKADAFYVRHDDGVWLRNNRGSFTIRGESAYPLVAALFSRLDGRRSVEQICADLPAPARRSVSGLLGTLHRNGFVKQLHHPPEQVPDWMRERYATHLAFLDHHGDRPVHRFQTVRSAPVVCAGQGTALRAAVGALAEFGFAAVTVVAAAADAAAVAPITGDGWQVVTAPDWTAVADLPHWRTAAYVLLAVDDADPARLAGLQVRMHTEGRSVAVLGRCGARVVALPGGTLQRCWECAWRRLTPPVTGDAGDLPTALVPATIAALHLVQRAFAALAGITLADAETVASVEPLAPVVRVHTVHPHPWCRHHPERRPPDAPDDEPVRPDLPFAEDDPALVAVSDRIVAATGEWTDRIAGPLLSVGEQEVDQLPLAGSCCRTSDPQATADDHTEQTLLCRAVSPREARNQVVLFTLEHLARQLSAADRVVYGAGWSVAEAEYRAALAAAYAAPPGDHRRLPPDSRDDRPLRLFLIETLAAADRPWSETSLEHLDSGFVRARVRTTGGPETVGVGLDERHAVDQALLHAVTPGTTVAHLAPPADTWSAALTRIRRPHPAPAPQPPFLAGHAHLAAVTLPGDPT
ncbi:hypothetical protein Q0Z83_043120 [Actinoplanes sichuanensis]|nr:hypothetical protein Q0Z83_043120 [Actinoplanes sichuanensis]